ncbi:MAG TPA: transcriptional regulator, partial [Halomonas sp.]|nr:transcriptional regulator [Halomonas sp.]
MTATSEEHAALRIASGRKPFVEPLRLGERLKQIR